MDKRRVLIVDHTPSRRSSLKELLAEKHIEALEASSCEDALSMLGKEELSVVLTETELPNKSGLYLLKRAKELTPEVEVILITHNASSYNLLQALRNGAYDFIVRPIDTGEILFNALNRVYNHIQLRKQNVRLLTELEAKNRSLLRNLKMMKALNESVERLAAITDIEKLLKALLASAVEVLRAKRGFLALIDRTSGELGIKVSQGVPVSVSRECSVRLPPGLIVEMARRGKPVLIPHDLPPKLASLASTVEHQALIESTRGLLAVPLHLKDRVAGIVVLLGHQLGHPYGEHDLHFLIQLSHHAALGLEKAGVIHQLRQSMPRRDEAL